MPTPEGAAYAPFGRVPTLYPAKRDGGHLMSRKLSKRRKNSNDREREAELKALRDFTPVRPATDAWTSGRPLKKDNRRVKSGGFAIVKNPWGREQHPSDVSLPLAESIHSSLSTDSEQVSYKVSTFDVLAPKPTLRRTTNPRCTRSQSITGTAPTRVDSQRRKVSSKSQIPEATLKAHKRVDDLANDLDASDLRELMERDKRRRERKREREQEKIQSKLARRAEKERRAVEKGRESPANLERGVLGRESVGLGIDATSAVVTSSRRRQSGASPTKKSEKRPEDVAAAARANGADGETEEPQRPLDVFHRVDSIVLEEATSPSKQDLEEPIMPPAQEQSPKVKGFLRSKKSRSKSPLSVNAQSDISGTPRNASEASSRGPMSWTSFFKWGLGTKRSSGPSSFSNTSRDSMSTQPPAQTQPISPFNVTFIPPGAAGRGTGAPKRTRSRFREDLPEHPLSTSDSGMQSPDFHAMPPVIKEQDSPAADAMPAPSPPINIPGRRHDTPVFDDVRRTPSSLFRDGVQPSPEPQQAMSLASIDSEGSWLTGRIRSGRLSSQTKQRPVQMFEGPDDDMTDAGENADDSAGIADDEYLNRVASRASNMVYPAAWAGHESTGELRPSSDEDDDPRWGAVSGKQPEVVRLSPAGRIKSREGLLNMVRPVTAPDDNSEPGSPASPASPLSNASEDVGHVQRATSINLDQAHARHISAGSARLLDLSPRSSTDVKRKSWSADNRLPEMQTS